MHALAESVSQSVSPSRGYEPYYYYYLLYYYYYYIEEEVE